MPQLMPLNWCMSFMVVLLLFMMMMTLYFKWCNCYNFVGNNGYKNKMVYWKW